MRREGRKLFGGKNLSLGQSGGERWGENWESHFSIPNSALFGDDGEEKGREGGKRPESNFLSPSLLLLLAERDQANFLAEAAWDELGKQERRRMETFSPSSLFFVDPFAFAFTCSGEPLALSQTRGRRAVVI